MCGLAELYWCVDPLLSFRIHEGSLFWAHLRQWLTIAPFTFWTIFILAGIVLGVRQAMFSSQPTTRPSSNTLKHD
jgi:hypothetical protein